eukprot:UN33295
MILAIGHLEGENCWFPQDENRTLDEDKGHIYNRAKTIIELKMILSSCKNVRIICTKTGSEEHIKEAFSSEINAIVSINLTLFSEHDAYQLIK